MRKNVSPEDILVFSLLDDVKRKEKRMNRMRSVHLKVLSSLSTEMFAPPYDYMRKFCRFYYK